MSTAARALLLAAGLAAIAAPARAGSAALRYCDRPSTLTATQRDRLLAFAAVVKSELEASRHAVALVARSGLNLERFGLRYSHAGVSLKANPNGPWSVRQLYYACDERAPRLYDQGLAGFLFGTDDPSLGYVSIVVLPGAPTAALERAALDTPRALRLVGADYSANAYAYGLRYQNCNQWVMELLASAWGDLSLTGDTRAEAQRWLTNNGYAPAPVQVPSRWLMFAGGFVPWLRMDDHPDDDLQAMRFRTSVPRSIEVFVREQAPGAERIELCHNSKQVVIRRGWTPIADGCVAADGDRVVSLTAP